MPIPFVGGGGLPKTKVFWDIEDCLVPDGLDAYTTRKNICSALYAKGYDQGRFDVIGFGDIFQTETNFGVAGIRIAHVLKGEKDERLNFILVKLLIEAMGADYDTNFVLIVGDISGHSGFLRALRHLKSRTSNHVILAQQPDVLSRKLKRVVTSAWLWSSLSAGGEPFFHQTRTRPFLDKRGPRFIASNTVIFWDVEDCQIPDGLNDGVVSQNIKSALANCGIVSKDEFVPIYAYGGDTMKHFQGLELHDRGLCKDARVEKILVDLLCCLIDQPHTTNLMLILGDITGQGGLVLAANLLRNLNFNVLLASTHTESEDLCIWPGKVWLWSSLSVGGNHSYSR